MGLFSFLTTRPLQWRLDTATLLADDIYNTRFINRVKEKNPQWSRSMIGFLIEDYRKFMFVAASSDESCTPSRDVDIIWHEHILFTRDYINHWCGKVLRKVVHHDPGTLEEQPKFKAAYEATQSKIKKTYDSPKESILPDLADSLGDAIGAILDHTSHSSHSSHHSSDHGHSSHDSGGSHGHSSCGSSGGHSSCSSGSSCSSSSCGSSCGGGGD